MNNKELIEDIQETLDDYDECYERGMEYEQGYGYARQMRDLLISALELLKGI